MSKETFKNFGSSFEDRFLQACLLDIDFFQKVWPICKEEYFTDIKQNIWTIIIEYFKRYNRVPTYEAIRVEIGKLKSETAITNSIAVLKILEEDTDSRLDLEHTKETSFEFLSDKEFESAILECADYLQSGKKDQIKSRIEKAMKHVYVVDTGHEYFDSLNLRTVDDIRNTVPTGFKMLDHVDILDGGLAGGEIGVFMAPTGGGKSFWLTSLGYGALKNGLNVVHYTLELSEVAIGKRYDAIISGIPIKKIKDNVQLAESKIKEFKKTSGSLIIKEFPTRTSNIHKFKFHIDRLRASGFEPHLIILDYADLMLSTKAYEQRTWELEAIYEELRGYSMECNIPIWTACQTNRAGLEEDIIGLDKIADAYAKAQVADFIATFSRNQYEKSIQAGKLYIAKNRIGYDGKIFQVHFDPSVARIDIYEEMSEDGPVNMNLSGASGKIEDDINSVFERFKQRREEHYGR